MKTKSQQTILNLLGCCGEHDEAHCNVDCFHGAGEDACPCGQKIVCCRNCPYWHYTKMTYEQFSKDRISVAGLLDCTPEQAGWRGWGAES